MGRYVRCSVYIGMVLLCRGFLASPNSRDHCLYEHRRQVGLEKGVDAAHQIAELLAFVPTQYRSGFVHCVDPLDTFVEPLLPRVLSR